MQNGGLRWRKITRKMGQNFIALADRATIADVATLAFANKFVASVARIDFSEFPKLSIWSEKMFELEGVKRAYERVKTFGIKDTCNCSVWGKHALCAYKGSNRTSWDGSAAHAPFAPSLMFSLLTLMSLYFESSLVIITAITVNARCFPKHCRPLNPKAISE